MLKVNSATYESQSQTAGKIVPQGITIELLLFIAFANLARKSRPSLAYGIVEAIAVMKTKYIPFHFVATFDSHVLLRFSLFHDSLLIPGTIYFFMFEYQSAF